MNTEIILHSIMEKMHQITWFMMELEKKEISDNIKISKEQIDNNKFLEKLYQNLQEDYIDLQNLIEKYISKNNITKEDKEGTIKQPEKIILEDLDDSLPVLSHKICEYLEASYINIGYISSEDEEFFYPGIYADTPFEKLNYAEYDLELFNIICLQQRIGIQNRIGKLSFLDKKAILKHIALEKFYEEYAFKKIDKDISNIDEIFAQMPEEQRRSLMERLIEQKYVLYMSYLNNKYNGLLQEGEREKLGIVKYSLRNGNIKTFLNMSEFEIEANISRDYEQLKQELKESIKNIIKEEKRKNQIRNSKNINEKLAKDEKSDVKVEKREI